MGTSANHHQPRTLTFLSYGDTALTVCVYDDKSHSSAKAQQRSAAQNMSLAA